MLLPDHADVTRIEDQSRAFAELFGGVFALFHRRVPKRSALTPESWAVLEHFRLAGPLTVTEAARHMARAQSVMSEMLARLEGRGLLQRLRDGRDARRVLVWLTDRGRATLIEQAQILDGKALSDAMARLSDGDRAQLLHSLECLLQRSTAPQPHQRKERP